MKLNFNFGKATINWPYGNFQNPDVRLFFSVKRVIVLLICAVTGLLPFIPIKETHYEIFLPMAMKK